MYEWKHLVHDTGLAVTIGILLGVELVHEAGLSLGVNSGTSGAGGGRTVVVSSSTASGGTSGSAGNVVVVNGGTSSGTSESTGASVGRGAVATDRAGLTLEAIVALLAASQDTALLLELGHANSGKGGSGVVLGSVVVNLVDGNSGVGNVRLNSLLLNNRLNGLVDVVVDVLASKSRSDGLCVALSALDALVTELCGLGLETLSNLSVIAVLELAVLNGGKVVVVLLGENLAVLYGLNRGVVVVLVDLLVDGGLDILVTLTVDGLVCDTRGNLLVDGSVVVARLGTLIACQLLLRRS